MCYVVMNIANTCTCNLVSAKKNCNFTVDRHEILHAAIHDIDDLNSMMGCCVEVGPDSRIVSRSTQFLDKVELFWNGR